MGNTDWERWNVAKGRFVADGLDTSNTFKTRSYDYSTMFKRQKMGMVGSSITHRCTRQQPSILADINGFLELDDACLSWGKSTFGLPLDVVYNGGVDGANSTEILENQNAMIAAFPNLDWHWLEFGMNDMQQNFMTAKRCFELTKIAIDRTLSVGAKAIVVIPHMSFDATAVRIANVAAYEVLCREYADTFPDQIVIWSNFKYVSANFGGYTPRQLLTLTWGVHLSVEGAMVAGNAAIELSQKINPLVVSHKFMEPR